MTPLDSGRMTKANPVYVALDTPSLKRALELAGQVKPFVGGVKVGLEFFNANGPQGVSQVIAAGLPVFLDLKLHDIPNTVAGAMKSLLPLGVSIVNLHASGGAAMIKAAADTLKDANPRPKLIAVTVLTSLEAADLKGMGIASDPLEQVVRLAKLAQASGADGVVCSPQEIGAVRAACGRDFLIITPGVRPDLTAKDDQKRVMTPAQALASGADILVVGRPITAAADPAEAARAIARDLGCA
jgi:orotidine-5'-phosphate decarboxylase